MSDTISRQAAIDTDGLDEEIRCEMCKNPMHTSKGCDGNCEYDERLYERIMQILGKMIKPLPSAQPTAEPVRHGKWAYGEDEYGIDGYHCDKCGFFVPWDYTHKFIDFIKDYRFCPNCGAKMDGEKENTHD